MYLRLTRFDLLYALHALSLVACDPGLNGIRAIKRILNHVVRPKGTCRIFHPSGTSCGIPKIIALTDSERASNRMTRKTVSGNLIYLGRNLIRGKSKIQRIMSGSFADAELDEIHETAKVIWNHRVVS